MFTSCLVSAVAYSVRIHPVFAVVCKYSSAGTWTRHESSFALAAVAISPPLEYRACPSLVVSSMSWSSSRKEHYINETSLYLNVIIPERCRLFIQAAVHAIDHWGICRVFFRPGNLPILYSRGSALFHVNSG